MAKTEIRKDHYETIVKALYSGSCVPFLGAGVNLTCAEGEPGLPLGGDLALSLLKAMLSNDGRGEPGQKEVGGAAEPERRDSGAAIKTDIIGRYRKRTDAVFENVRREMILEKVRAELPAEFEKMEGRLRSALRSILPDDEQHTRLAHVIIDDTLEQFRDLTRVALQDLARVSMRYRVNKDLGPFVDKLKELIPDNERKPSLLLKTLARLPLRLIVTTNYDRLMERSLELFSEGAVRDPAGLAAEVGKRATPLTDSMYRAMPDELREQVLGGGVEATSARWAEALNHVIQDTRLYLFEDEPGLLAAALTFEVFDRIYKKPEGVAQVARNRRLIEAAFSEYIEPHQTDYRVLVQPIGGVETTVAQASKIMSQHDGTVIYKLHGSFTDGEPEEATRPVITEEDYIEFLTFVGGRGEGIENQIKDRITQSTLLFLGYSLEDWNFRALFKGLIEKAGGEKGREKPGNDKGRPAGDAARKTPISYAIQKDPSDFWVTFWDKKGVQILDVDICEFAHNLYRHCREFEEERRQKAEDDRNRTLRKWQGGGKQGDDQPGDGRGKVVRVARF